MNESIRVEVFDRLPREILESHKRELEELLETKISKSNMSFCYELFSESDFKKGDLEEIFFDEVAQEIYFEMNMRPYEYFIDISFRPGVKDNPGEAAQRALDLFGQKAKIKSHRSFELSFESDLDKTQKSKIIEAFYKTHANELIEEVRVFSSDEDRFKELKEKEVILNSDQGASEISLDLSDNKLIELSEKMCLALTLEEMKCIKEFYEREETKKERREKKLPLWPTDVELEVLAQTWSEHCKHKIFNANIEYKEGNHQHKKFGDVKIKSLFKSYIKSVTDNNQKDWLESVFVDNAGVISLNDELCACMKVETHNSPSALDPYGGAITGILGVNRDIMGTGLGAKPIANTDIFCFAPPDFPNTQEKELFPKGLLSPKRILDGVHKGVIDGGNKSGIPTVNGGFFFDVNYTGKPLVYVGTLGVMPKKLKNGRDAVKADPKSGDLIFMVGGAIGADGIHGATFSSLELDESSPASAVQIGDPFTQKKVLDFLLVARDRGLISAITDNGAGGLSSSIGEMAELCGGAQIDLALAPTKYPGLRPFELMISESQERMSLAINPKDEQEFKELALTFEVEATKLGAFNDSGFLDVYYQKDLVASLQLDFLHDGLPPMNLEATWEGELNVHRWHSSYPSFYEQRKIQKNITLKESLEKLLSSPNICSKESLVRQYDHEVMGQSALKPYSGSEGDIPGNSGALWMGRYCEDKELSLVTGLGMAPRMSLSDPYIMAQFAVDEAVRNMVCHGGDPAHMALLDNFCWPDPIKSEKNPQGDKKLGALVRTCMGLKEICDAYELPLISGKDSMKNDYVSKETKDLRISVLPTLLVSGLAKSNLKKQIPSYFTRDGDLIYLLGKKGSGLKFSEFDATFKDLSSLQEKTPSIELEANKELYFRISSLIDKELLSSCHDISEGGLLCALFEASMDSGCEIKTNSTSDQFDYFYNEAPGQMLVSIKPEKQNEFLNQMKELDFEFLGEVTNNGSLNVEFGEQKIEWDIKELKKIYKGVFCD